MLELKEISSRQPFEYMDESKATEYCKIIKPIQRYDNNIPYLIENLNNLECVIFIPYIWLIKNPNPKIVSNNFIFIKDLKYTKLNMQDFKILTDVEMSTRYYYDGQPSPTLHEIFSQIPNEYISDVIAFEIIKKNGSIVYFSPRLSEKNGDSDFCLRNNDYYSFDIRLYAAK